MLLFLFASIFVNGVNADALRDQSFEKCKTVRIDKRGDVFLDCPAYQIEPVGGVPLATASLAPATAITKHYYLVSETKDGASVQYDVDVFVNSKWVRKLKSTEDQIVIEISKYLQPGANKILFAATKHIEAGRKSTSPGAYIKIIVGEGESGGGNVMIDNPLIELKRSAAETETVNEEFTIQGR